MKQIAKTLLVVALLFGSIFSVVAESDSTGNSSTSSVIRVGYGEKFSLVPGQQAYVGPSASGAVLLTLKEIAKTSPAQAELEIASVGSTNTLSFELSEGKSKLLLNGVITVTFFKYDNGFAYFTVDNLSSPTPVMRYVDFGQVFNADAQVNIGNEYVLQLKDVAIPDCTPGSTCNEFAEIYFGYYSGVALMKTNSVVERAIYKVYKGTTQTILGAQVTYYGNSQFIVNKGISPSTVQIKLTPESQTVKTGETAKYTLAIKDGREGCGPTPTDGSEMCTRGPAITYSIRTSTSFQTRYQKEVSLLRGQQTQVDIYVDTYTAVSEGGSSGPVSVTSTEPITGQTTSETNVVSHNINPLPHDVVIENMPYTISVVVQDTSNPSNSARTTASLFIQPVSQQWVNVVVDPQQQTAQKGDTVTYSISVRDMHPLPMCPVSQSGQGCSDGIYTYHLSVSGLPFLTTYDKTVQVNGGGEKTLRLTIDTSQEQSIQPPNLPEDSSHQLVAVGFFPFTVSAKGDDGSFDTALGALTLQESGSVSEYTIPLHKGWNLVSLPPKEFVEFVGTSGKLVGFVWLQDKQEYVTMSEAENLLGSGFKSYISRNGFWIYTDRENTIIVQMEGDVSLNALDLVNGWTILSTVYRPGLGDYSIRDLTPSCAIKTIWDWSNDHWEKVSPDAKITSYFQFKGLLVRNENTCQLHDPSSIIVPPPMPLPSTPEKKVCTAEAKVCPDGKTYVGRTGPNCEFAACPGGG